MAGERQTEAHQALHSCLNEHPRLSHTMWLEAELARVRAENERLRRSARGETYTDEGTQLVLDDLRRTKAELERLRAERDEALFDASVAVTERDMAVTSAVQQATTRQAAEIVALLRSYTNVHMTKALADLIEHKYVNRSQGQATTRRA